MTGKFVLVIGNKNYSSWSLRPWLVLKQAGIPFQEVLIPLYDGDYKRQIMKYSSAGKVPILLHGKNKIWESIAIGEYVADLFPRKKLWPTDKRQKALALSISAEMHSGFVPLRTNMPMNVRKNLPGKGLTPEVAQDIARIQEIWNDCRQANKKRGKFLFGHFTIADAMYAPVVFRFHTYGVSLSGLAQEYCEMMSALSAMQEWKEAGCREPWMIAASEKYTQP